jgi:hypothetical protein
MLCRVFLTNSVSLALVCGSFLSRFLSVKIVTPPLNLVFHFPRLQLNLEHYPGVSPSLPKHSQSPLTALLVISFLQLFPITLTYHISRRILLCDVPQRILNFFDRSISLFSKENWRIWDVHEPFYPKILHSRAISLCDVYPMVGLAVLAWIINKEHGTSFKIENQVACLFHYCCIGILIWIAV